MSIPFFVLEVVRWLSSMNRLSSRRVLVILSQGCSHMLRHRLCNESRCHGYICVRHSDAVSLPLTQTIIGSALDSRELFGVFE